MNLPLENKLQLESLLDGYSLKELKNVASSIMEQYQNNSNKGVDLINSSIASKVYAVYRLPATYSAFGEALKHTLELYDQKIDSVIDAGAGSGSASIAVSNLLPNIKNYILLERNKYMMEIGKTLHNFGYINYDLSKDNLDIKADLVISNYVLNELDINSRINAINKMWNMTNKMMLIVEPGTPEGFSLIREIRDYLISIGAYVIAPCTHMGVCLNTWCHFSTRVSRSKLHKDLKGGDAPYEDEKYCYIAFSKIVITPCKNRILRHPQINPGFVELEVCSKDGFKKIKYSKKDKELFKRARKSDAGDQI